MNEVVFYNYLKQNLNDRLKERIKKDDITLEEELEKYYSPLSSENIELINKVYKTNFSTNEFNINNDEYVRFVFARFIYSWSNSGYVNWLKADYGEEIKIITCDFNLNDFLRKYNPSYKIGGLELFNDILQNKTIKPIRNLIKVKRFSNLLSFCEGICSIAKVLNDLKRFLNFNNKTTYTEVINGDIEELLVGMSWALLSDAVKESDLADVVKPDVHIVKIINAMYDLDLSETLTFNNIKETNEKFALIVQAVNKELPLEKLTLYKLDKMLWLAFSLNFYLHDKTNKKGRKTNQELLLKEMYKLKRK